MPADPPANMADLVQGEDDDEVRRMLASQGYTEPQYVGLNPVTGDLYYHIVDTDIRLYFRKSEKRIVVYSVRGDQRW